MRVVLALDKFKGTFSAREACELLAEGIRHRNPKIEVLMRPMADGGEGTASILSAALGMDAMRVTVPDLLGKKIEARVHWQDARRMALVESAEVLGVTRAAAQEGLLLKSNTLGLGVLLQKAFDLRPSEIWVGVGGTMTADAGWGLASAFGLRAFDADGNVLEPCLSNMDKVSRVEPPAVVPDYLRRTKVVALCDVAAPAFGTHVSLSSFLAQKGATKNSIEAIEKKISTFWGALRAAGLPVAKLEDAFTGAGGGICIGLSAVLPNYRFEHGAQTVARATALGACVQNVDVTICGEGCFDELTLYGKTATVVSQVAADHRSECWGVFGRTEGDIAVLKQKLGIDKVFTLFDKPPAKNIDLVKRSRLRFQEIGIEIAHAVESLKT